MIYENNESNAEQNSLERFHIELLFSPGLYPCFLTEKEQIYEKRFNSHKNKPSQALSGVKKSKNNSTKTSGDQSEKEDAEVPANNLPSSSSNKSNEFATPETATESAASTHERVLLSNKQPSPTASNTSSNTQVSTNKECEEEAHESDDELTDHAAINLVVLGEVAGKKFSEMGKSNQQEQLPRKRHPTPELKSVVEDEAEYGRVHKSVKELGKCLSSDSEPPIKDGDRRPLRIDTSTQRSSNTIVKSMSDILSNRTTGCADEPSIAPIDEDLLESPDSGLTLDASQATVGSSQGWAKDAKSILSGNKNETDSQKQQSESVEGSSTNSDQKPQQSSGYQRPLLTTIFSQNNEPSETKQSETEESTPAPESNDQGAGQITSQNSRDEETSNSTRRSRFPYRFKHHTVNLLTGGSVENRLISTAVLMDTTRRKANNTAILSTAVIGRSSSAPRLQTFKAGDEIQVTEIKCFWPPLRSLEALCNISFKQFDQFLERMLTLNTPLPSPPRTPIQRESEAQSSFQQRLDDTIKRLNMFEGAEKKATEKKN